MTRFMGPKLVRHPRFRLDFVGLMAMELDEVTWGALLMCLYVRPRQATWLVKATPLQG